MSIFQRLAWFKWTGILLVCIGLVVKAIHPKARFQKVTNTKTITLSTFYVE